MPLKTFQRFCTKKGEIVRFRWHPLPIPYKQYACFGNFSSVLADEHGHQQRCRQRQRQRHGHGHRLEP
jgi:hypothetical protein